MSNQSYPEEFKIEAVKHITERGLRVADVAERLGVSGISRPLHFGKKPEAEAIKIILS